MGASGLRWSLIIIIGALLLFVPGLGSVHLFDWDEINFAEIAREMVVTGDHLRPQIDFLPFHEKPPLFMWLQALCMHLFGIGEFAARLPNALCGVITLLVIHRIGTRLRGGTFGLLWVMAYVGSILPHLYFRSGIIDPWFNLFIFLGLDRIISMGERDAPPQHGWLAGVFLGLAVLTKGPVGVLVPMLTIGVYFLLNGSRFPFAMRDVVRLFAALLLVAGSWAVVDHVRNGPEFMVAFFQRQLAMLTTEDAGHGGFFGYHVVVLVLGCFPASIFAVAELLRPTRERAHLNEHRRWMVLLFWVVLILFSLVRTKIVHYSSLAYFPLTYLAALTLEKLWRSGKASSTAVRLALGIIGSVFGIVACLLPVIGNNIHIIRPLAANDPFALANLDADVHWSGSEALAGAWLLITLGLAIHWMATSAVRRGIFTLFAGSTVFITLFLGFNIRKIERYTQGAAIDFFKERQDERCYVITKEYKSYAHLFYSAKPPVTDERAHDEQWLLHGSMDRPVYVVCKITSLEDVRRIRDLSMIGTKNGFVFWKREGRRE